MATDVATRASAKRPQGCSTEPGDQRLMKALTKLWLRTRHTANQEVQREEIFSLWLKDLSHWPNSQTIPALTQLATTEEWWPAWSMVVKKLPAPANAIGYDDPWNRIKFESVRAWADDVARSYLRTYQGDASFRERQALADQATRMVIRNGKGDIGLQGGPLWDGERCLRISGRDRAA